jgi:hypothetical protein
MRAAAAIHESFWPRLVVAIDSAVGRRARDSVLTAQVRYRHLFLLITRQELQTLIQIRLSYQGIPHHRASDQA